MTIFHGTFQVVRHTVRCQRDELHPLERNGMLLPTACQQMRIEGLVGEVAGTIFALN